MGRSKSLSYAQDAEVHVAGRWEVRIGLRGSKHVYLGLHSSEVEAARVYDRALVLLTGSSAATNFPVSNYTKELEAYQKCALCPFQPIGSTVPSVSTLAC